MNIETVLEYYVVVLPKGKTTVEGLLSSGQYEEVNGDVSDRNFPVTGSRWDRELGIELVHVGHSSPTDQILLRLDIRGLRPATAAELLALGAKYPDLQRQFPIVALGQEWRGRAVFLDGSRKERTVRLGWRGGSWNANYRFAAIHK